MIFSSKKTPKGNKKHSLLHDMCSRNLKIWSKGLVCEGKCLSWTSRLMQVFFLDVVFHVLRFCKFRLWSCPCSVEYPILASEVKEMRPRGF